MTETTRTYLLDYRLDGGTYCLELRAASWAEAERHVAAIKAWGKIQGEVGEVIPAVPGAGLLTRLLVWWRNARA